MLLQDVLGAPGLGMRLLHGDAAMLDRPVLRACTTDMPNPARYVSAGSLVFSGLVWRRTAEDADLFVKILARAGVAALAAGEGLLGEVPRDVVAACQRHRLPLLGVPEDVPFSTVIEYMTSQLAGARMERLQTGLARQRQLLSAVADGRSLDELIGQLAGEFGVFAWLITATGTTLAGPAPLPDDELDRITKSALTADRFPAQAPGGYTVLSVGAGFEDNLTGWYLVLRPCVHDHDPGDAFGGEVEAECVEAFTEFGAVAAVDRVRRDERRRITWEAADGAPAGDGPATGRCPVVAVVLAGSPAPSRGQRDALRAVVYDALPGVATTVDADGRVVALLEGDEADVVALLRRRLGRLAPTLSRMRLLVGVSRCGTGESIDGGIQAATAAAAAAHDEPGPVCVRAADLDSAFGLLASVPDHLRRTFTERLLGPVFEHDRRTDGGLLATLETFLDCDGSWRRTADRLHLHLNTVRYRIGRVEALTGRDLGRTADRLDIYLALRSLP